MVYKKILIIALVFLAGASCFAAEEKVKTQGLEMVPDTATAVVNKATALITGDLECTMTIGKDKYRDDYTLDPQGRRIPRATLKKYDSGVR